MWKIKQTVPKDEQPWQRRWWRQQSCCCCRRGCLIAVASDLFRQPNCFQQQEDLHFARFIVTIQQSRIRCWWNQGMYYGYVLKLNSQYIVWLITTRLIRCLECKTAWMFCFWCRPVVVSASFEHLNWLQFNFRKLHHWVKYFTKVVMFSREDSIA